MGCAPSEYARVHTALLYQEAPPSFRADCPLDYRIGPGDVLALRCSDQPRYNGCYTVLPNGCIVLPDIGAVAVAGLTTEQVAEKLRDLLGESAGLVFAEVVDYEHQRIYLIGEVHGGSRAISYQGPETITQLLRRAGGLTPDADPTAIRIHRLYGFQGAEEIVAVDLVALFLENDQRQNVYVQPYDRIVVPRNRWASLRACLPTAWAQWFAWWSASYQGSGVNSSP
jgi:polysaccharide export outer membrane protein